MVLGEEEPDGTLPVAEVESRLGLVGIEGVEFGGEGLPESGWLVEELTVVWLGVGVADGTSTVLVWVCIVALDPAFAASTISGRSGPSRATYKLTMSQTYW